MVFSEKTYGVLIVSASQKFSGNVAAMLPPSDFWPVDTVASAGEARRAQLQRGYDIVLINTPLGDEFGSQLAVDICVSSDACAMLFVKSDIYDDVYAKVMEHGVLTVPKPTSVQLVQHSIKTLCSMRERIRRLEEKQTSIEEKIAEIRTVNHAKWLLIECLSMTEPDAQRYIEKQSMDTRVSKREIAENIIKTYG